MKKICILLLLFCCYSTVAQEIRYIDKGVVEIWYNENLQSPVEARYIVECPGKGIERKGFKWYVEPGVKTADNDDFYKNVWDKGHLAPFAAFNCNREMANATFSYANAALQHESLNRGQWKDLESYERRLANQYGYVQVMIYVEFDKEPKRVPAGAAIPSGFFKTILYYDGDSMRSIQYYFPNTKLENRDVRNYIIKSN